MERLSAPGAAGAATAGATPAPPASRAAGRPARQRPAPRPVPVRNRELAHLDLEGLRTYRTALQAEEGNVSYWRRIVQARLDVVREGRTRGGTRTLDAAALRPVLTDARVGSGRRAFVQIMPVDDIPPLPNLAELWEREVDPRDEEAGISLEHDLTAAERQLSAYRSALHARLSAATDELVARYRGDPTACLTSLPLDPRRA